MIAGIRSERFLNKEKSEKNRVAFHVDVIENLGKEQSLFVKLPSGKDLVMTMPGHYHFVQGQAEEFAFDNEAMHYFDGETKKRI